MATINELINQLESFASDNKGTESIGSDGLSSKQFKEAAQSVSEELIALQAIYGEESISLLLLQDSRKGSVNLIRAQDEKSTEQVSSSVDFKPQQPIRLALNIPLNLEMNSTIEENITIRISANLPPGYPFANKAPQLQLLSHYIGSHGVDHTLFGQILRIFIQSNANSLGSQHVKFEQGNVGLFDGIEKARELIEAWYEERESERKLRILSNNHSGSEDLSKRSRNKDDGILKGFQNVSIDEHIEYSSPKPKKPLDEIKVFSSPAIIDRKSTFVGHAARLYNPSEVPTILAKILQDRKIARASHPTMYAWVCRTNSETKNGTNKGSSIVHRDCDDDGETAAGGRLAHLLDLCRIENAMVIVTRWYGGVHLGSDRFKLINRAARDALELAGLVDGPLNPSSPTSSKNQKSS